MQVANALLKQDLTHIAMSLHSKRARDVELALEKSTLDLGDFIALLSPAAGPYLEAMAKRSQLLTRHRFGNTMNLFVPLYLSNLCANECSYCGFTMSNKIKRTTLSIEDTQKEIAAIKAMGFTQVLLVTGEHETKVGVDYFQKTLKAIRNQVSYLMMEVQPLEQCQYEALKQTGLDAVLVYQETYSPHLYAKYHTRGKKKDFLWRLEAPDRIGAAGIDKIGIGALLGLGDWRVDSVMTALHGQLLQQHYWRSRVSISFPRLRSCEGNTGKSTRAHLPNEQELLQIICAHRLFNPQVELSLSTRESAQFRDGALSLGVTSMSAASQTQPGGYNEPTSALSQFQIDDDRAVEAVVSAIEAKGLEVLWKDWESFTPRYQQVKP